MAPNFVLSDQNGNIHRLKDLSGKFTLIYFYPKDNTPGCTAQACSLRDHIEDLRADGLLIYGVSADTADSHQKFADKYNLPFPLLADPDKDMIEAYGAWGERSMYGRKFMGIIRSAVIIGPDLKIEAHWQKIQPLKTVSTIRSWIKTQSR